MGAIGYDCFVSVLNSGVWINARLLLSFPFFFSYFLTTRLVRCQVHFLLPPTCFLSLSFFLSFFLFHVRVTIFDVSWCHVRQSRKITIATIECKMILNTKVTVYEYWFLARA
jgi:hypothetical protein